MSKQAGNQIGRFLKSAWNLAPLWSGKSQGEAAMPHHEAIDRTPGRESRKMADRSDMIGRLDGGRREPVFADMLSDPIFLDLMASDGVPMDGFMELVESVRGRLGSGSPADRRAPPIALGAAA
jgi:hypothetical protein